MVYLFSGVIQKLLENTTAKHQDTANLIKAGSCNLMVTFTTIFTTIFIRTEVLNHEKFETTLQIHARK